MVAKHKNQLLNDLLEFINSNRVSVARFAKEAGLPRERVYKWYQENNNPKVEDVERIKKWLRTLNAENIPRELRNLITSAEETTPRKVGTDQEKYVELLERDRNFFESSLKDNLNLITANLTELLRSQRYDRAQLTTLLAVTSRTLAKIEKRDIETVFEETNKAVNDQIRGQM